MKTKIFLTAVVLLSVAGCFGARAQDTIVRKDSTFFFGHLNWYDLDTLHLWRSTIDDRYCTWYDTILEGDSCYYSAVIYPTWLDTSEYADINPPLCHLYNDNGGGDRENYMSKYFLGNTIIGNQMVTDHPIKIIGLAACGRMQSPADTTQYELALTKVWYDEWRYNRDRLGWYFPNTRDMSMAGRITDSLILYKPTDGDPVKLASGPWRVEWPHREILLPLEDSTLRCKWRTWGLGFFPPLNNPVYYDSTPTVALYEVYFEKPEVVEDSFIVAGTALNNEGSYSWEQHGVNFSSWMWLWNHCPTRYWNLYRSTVIQYGGNETGFGFDPDTTFWDWGQPKWIKYRNERWGRIARYPNARIIFPIIQPEWEPCHPMENVRVAGLNKDTVTLMWDAANNTRWQVRFGTEDMFWENYYLVETRVPMVTLTGLRPGKRYLAYVRGWCPSDSSYTDWSDTLRFETEMPEGVEHPGIVGRYTRLMPNPAHGRVSVVSSYKVNRIEVYALDGRKMLEQEVGGISAIVDISTLEKGTYIAAIYLAEGVTTKKLIVE